VWEGSIVVGGRASALAEPRGRTQVLLKITLQDLQNPNPRSCGVRIILSQRARIPRNCRSLALSVTVHPPSTGAFELAVEGARPAQAVPICAECSPVLGSRSTEPGPQGHHLHDGTSVSLKS
jgi:hypothetical protein